MKISIITATYNSEKTIRYTLESVLEQTYNDIEYIIVDGASKDSTLDIVHQYELQFGGRMRIYSEPDKGIYDALNKGINYATGDVIGFIHADDFYASQDIVCQIVEVFEQSSCEILYGDLDYVNHDGQSVVRRWKSSPFKRRMLQRGWMPAHPTMYVKKSVHNNFGLYDTSFKISADYNFILHCFSNIDENEIAYLPTVVVKMRIGGASNKSIKNIIVKMKEDARAIKNNKIGIPWCIIFRKNFSKISQFIKK